jgi:RHS repeat-associated protein
MNQEQLKKWRAGQTAQQSGSTRSTNGAHFYTGRPYEAESLTYALMFRSYDAELNRWTTVDPSGFPDGPNNLAYLPCPTSEFDLQGLITMTVQNDADREKEFSGGLGGYANFSGSSWGSADSPNVTVSMYGISYAHLLDPDDETEIDFKITIVEESDGKLTYTREGNYESQADSGKIGINVEITGDHTKTITIRITAAWALNASTMSGAGVNASGGTVSFSDTSYSESFAFGDCVFKE